MAKLTARFDLQDRISKKLQTISSNAKKLEKSRAQLNRPITLKVRDEATRKLTRVHKFVLKDIAKTHMMFVRLRDQATRPLNKINTFMKRKMPRTHDLIIRAQDRTKTVLEKIRGYTRRHLAKPVYLYLEAKDRAMPILHRIANYARRQLSRGYNFSVRAIDIATKTVGRIASFARTAIPRYRDFTIRAWDRASRVIGTVRRALFSIPTMITVTLAVVGLGSLSKSTIGSAMNFEGYRVAMEHWLGGNTKQADELVKWMGQFADSTPFSSVELFPALSRGIGVTDGNIKDAKQLLTIASNMAALTPSRTVEDAMEALASAQMGEFELLKGYNMKITADDYADMGWTGFLDLMDSTFEDGAKKFSQTASGQLATLRGYTSSIFREAGVGILESMKPRLDAITTWLDNNQETWGRWKDTVQQAGLDASEWLFGKLENGFSHIRTNYLENDDFKNLDFEGKVKFIMEDLGAWWDKTGRPLLVDVSKDVGEAIFKGVTWGIKEGLKGIGSMWLDAFKNPSVEGFAGAGIATAIAGSILSLVLTPLFKGISGIFKSGKWFWDQGKKVGSLFGGGKGKPPSSGGGRGGGWFGSTFGRNKKQDYRNPWFGKGTKPELNVPNATTKAPKIPKVFSKIGNFGKKIPVLGTLLSGLALATAPKEEKAGVAGGIGGGMAGAAAGAAIGSVVPVIGTTIGGILGGIIGSIGGSAIGDWFSENWTSIKQGAKDAGAWVSDAWNKTWLAVKEFGADAGSWISDKFNKGVEVIRNKWSDFSGWFGDKIWTPVSDAAINTMNFVVGAWDIGREWVSEIWQGFSSWFDETVWQPVKEGAAAVGQWISDRYTEAKEWVSETWSSVSEWFNETVWMPVKEGAAIAGQWISDQYTAAKEWISETWGVFSGWFDEVVWTPIKTGAGIAGQWISDRYSEAKDWITDSWSVFSGWFDEVVWTPIKTGAEIAGAWIGEQFGNAVTWAKDAWEGISGWFDDNVWSPIKTGAQDAWSWIKGKWNDAKTWAGEITQRGESITGVTPSKKYANGGFITRPHLGLVGEAGPEAIIPLSATRRDRAMSLYEKTGQLLGVKPYANGGMVGTATLPQEQVSTVISHVKGDFGKGGSGRDIIVQITGDNHYENDMDAERVGEIAVKEVKKALEDDRFEGGEMVVYE